MQKRLPPAWGGAGTAFLRGTAAGVLLRRFSGGIFGALVVLYMSRDLGFSPGVLSMTWAVGGISAFIGATLAPPSTGREPCGRC
jgi:hypothetical protein